MFLPEAIQHPLRSSFTHTSYQMLLLALFALVATAVAGGNIVDALSCAPVGCAASDLACAADKSCLKASICAKLIIVNNGSCGAGCITQCSLLASLSATQITAFAANVACHAAGCTYPPGLGCNPSQCLPVELECATNANCKTAFKCALNNYITSKSCDAACMASCSADLPLNDTIALRAVTQCFEHYCSTGTHIGSGSGACEPPQCESLRSVCHNDRQCTHAFHCAGAAVQKTPSCAPNCVKSCAYLAHLDAAQNQTLASLFNCYRDGCVASNATCSKLNCASNLECQYTADGTYSCGCPFGNTLTNNVCVPINPCSTNNGGCGSNSICTFKGPGKHSCHCVSGYHSLLSNGRNCAIQLGSSDCQPEACQPFADACMLDPLCVAALNCARMTKNTTGACDSSCISACAASAKITNLPGGFVLNQLYTCTRDNCGGNATKACVPGQCSDLYKTCQLYPACNGFFKCVSAVYAATGFCDQTCFDSCRTQFQSAVPTLDASLTEPTTLPRTTKQGAATKPFLPNGQNPINATIPVDLFANIFRCYLSLKMI